MLKNTQPVVQLAYWTSIAGVVASFGFILFFVIASGGVIDTVAFGIAIYLMIALAYMVLPLVIRGQLRKMHNNGPYGESVLLAHVARLSAAGVFWGAISAMFVGTKGAGGAQEFYTGLDLLAFYPAFLGVIYLVVLIWCLVELARMRF